MRFTIRVIHILAVLGASAGLTACAPSEQPAEAPPAEPPPAEESPVAETPAEEPLAEALTEVPAEELEPQTFEVGEDALLEGIQPEGWEPSTPFEHYVVENLYNKINGRSEMYMSYNVKSLSWADFVNPDMTGRFIDVFVYDMQTPTGAFGVYAAEREVGQEKVDIGRAGYRTDGNVYFWKGQYYAYIQTSHDDETGREAAYSIAENLAARLKDTGEEVRGLDWLPTEGLIEDSITYFLVDAMSLDFMQDTFTAKYNFDGENETVCFISRKDTEAAASEVLVSFSEYLENYGDSVETITLDDGTEMVLGNLGGDFYDGIFHKGVTVAGVSAVRGRDNAIASANALANLLSE